MEEKNVFNETKVGGSYDRPKSQLRKKKKTSVQMEIYQKSFQREDTIH